MTEKYSGKGTLIHKVVDEISLESFNPITSGLGELIITISGDTGKLYTSNGNGEIIKLGTDEEALKNVYDSAITYVEDKVEEINDSLQLLSGDSHTHSNKSALDKISESDITRWNSFTASTVVQYSLPESAYEDLVRNQSAVTVNGIDIPWDENYYYAVYADETEEE